MRVATGLGWHFFLAAFAAAHIAGISARVVVLFLAAFAAAHTVRWGGVAARVFLAAFAAAHAKLTL